MTIVIDLLATLTDGMPAWLYTVRVPADLCLRATHAPNTTQTLMSQQPQIRARAMEKKCVVEVVEVVEVVGVVEVVEVGEVIEVAEVIEVVEAVEVVEVFEVVEVVEVVESLQNWTLSNGMK